MFVRVIFTRYIYNYTADRSLRAINFSQAAGR